MSAIKYGNDCCGDRYEVNAHQKCNCGCELYYCMACYIEHMICVAQILLKQFSLRDRLAILKKEIKRERDEYPTAKFKNKV